MGDVQEHGKLDSVAEINARVHSIGDKVDPCPDCGAHAAYGTVCSASYQKGRHVVVDEKFDSVERLLDTRGQEYGQSAWLTTGQILSALNLAELTALGWLSAFCSVLRKLVRAVRHPTNPEHWQDAEAYLRLIRQECENMYGPQPSDTGPSPHGAGT